MKLHSNSVFFYFFIWKICHTTSLQIGFRNVFHTWYIYIYSFHFYPYQQHLFLLSTYSTKVAINRIIWLVFECLHSKYMQYCSKLARLQASTSVQCNQSWVWICIETFKLQIMFHFSCIGFSSTYAVYYVGWVKFSKISWNTYQTCRSILVASWRIERHVRLEITGRKAFL